MRTFWEPSRPSKLNNGSLSKMIQRFVSENVGFVVSTTNNKSRNSLLPDCNKNEKREKMFISCALASCFNLTDLHSNHVSNVREATVSNVYWRQSPR